MKILVSCPIPEDMLPELRTLGAELIYEPHITAEKLEQAVRDVAILVICHTRVSPEVIEAGVELQMIVRFGGDTSNIAMEEASSAGVFVTCSPNMDAIAIAELAFGFLLGLDRKIRENVETPDLRRPCEKLPLDSWGLAGRSLGVLGFGPVEAEIIKRAKAFEMTVNAWAPTLSPETAAEHGVEFCAWPRELARQSDAVAVYASPAGHDETLIDADFLDNMRPEARLIYIGRPGGLDLSALVKAVKKRKLRVAYDISAPQLTLGDTARFISKLQKEPNVLGTYRLASCTRQAQSATSAELIRVIREFLVNGNVINCVNLLEQNPAKWQLVLRLKDRVGVMASVMEVIGADGLNSEGITTRLFTGGKAAWCIIDVDERPSEETLSAIRELDGVLNLELRALV